MAWNLFHFTRWVSGGSGLSPADRNILRCIALRTDPSGECYPSQGALAGDTGYHRATIQRAISRIIALPEVEAVRRPGHTFYYRLICTERVELYVQGVSHRATCSTERHVAQSDNGCRTGSHGVVAQSDNRCRTERHDRLTDRLTDRLNIDSSAQIADVEGSEPGRTTPTPGPQADCAGCSEDPAAQGPLCAECLTADPEIGTGDPHRGSGDHPPGSQAGERKRPARRHPRQQSYSGGLLNEDAEAIHEMLAQRQANVDDRVGFANYIAGHLGLQGGNKLTLARVRIMLDKVCGKAGARAAAAGDGAGPTSDDIADHTETWLSKPAEWWKDVEKKRAAEKQADEPARQYPEFKDDGPMERLSKEESVANAKRVRAMIAGAGIGNGGRQ